ncbi:DUF1488 family protein [Roseomonas sp. CCTCC AB2023176]|uniref:DUF1488 family protein n=1 Tax=Roseomonas sp. CCTCC AB2023176 TaxID=3342640 RepID=UPI0035DC0352
MRVITSASGPGARFRHDRVLFEVTEGTTTFACSVSKAAIQDASDGRPNLPDAVLAAFATLRRRIEVVAWAKIRARPDGAEGVVHVWSGDLDDDDPEPQPEQARGRRTG